MLWSSIQTCNIVLYLEEAAEVLVLLSALELTVITFSFFSPESSHRIYNGPVIQMAFLCSAIYLCIWCFAVKSPIHGNFRLNGMNSEQKQWLHPSTIGSNKDCIAPAVISNGKGQQFNAISKWARLKF